MEPSLLDHRIDALASMRWRCLRVATSQHRRKDIPDEYLPARLPPPGELHRNRRHRRRLESLVQATRLSAVDPGNPVFERTPVGTCGTPLPLDGYTLVTASDLAEAVELAKGCPIIKEGGGVEVGLLTPIPGREHPARIF